MLVFKEPLFYLIMASKCKSSDAGNSDMSKKSHKVLHLHEKVKVLDLIRKEKSLAGAAIYLARSFCAILKKEKEIARSR